DRTGQRVEAVENRAGQRGGRATRGDPAVSDLVGFAVGAVAPGDLDHRLQAVFPFFMNPLSPNELPAPPHGPPPPHDSNRLHVSLRPPASRGLSSKMMARPRHGVERTPFRTRYSGLAEAAVVASGQVGARPGPGDGRAPAAHRRATI